MKSSTCELMINEQLGLATWEGDKYGNTFVNHGGADIGYGSFICFKPEISLGVVALVNPDNLNTNQLGYQSLWILEEIIHESNKSKKPIDFL